MLLDQGAFATPPDKTNGGMYQISPDGLKMLGTLFEFDDSGTAAAEIADLVVPDSQPTTYILPAFISTNDVIANTGQVIVYDASSAAFVWSPTGEVVPLPSLYKVEGAI